MALIERLMELETPKIPIHTFYAAQHERIEGQVTRNQIVAFFGMDAAAAAEYDALAALAPTGTQAAAVAAKAMFISRVHAVFMLAAARVPGYDTAAAVRTKLGL